eukprot:7388916-Prymnesium_polylepis.1
MLLPALVRFVLEQPHADLAYLRAQAERQPFPEPLPIEGSHFPLEREGQDRGVGCAPAHLALRPLWVALGRRLRRRLRLVAHPPADSVVGAILSLPLCDRHARLRSKRLERPAPRLVVVRERGAVLLAFLALLPPEGLHDDQHDRVGGLCVDGMHELAHAPIGDGTFDQALDVPLAQADAGHRRVAHRADHRRFEVGARVAERLEEAPEAAGGHCAMHPRAQLMVLQNAVRLRAVRVAPEDVGGERRERADRAHRIALAERLEL